MKKYRIEFQINPVSTHVSNYSCEDIHPIILVIIATTVWLTAVCVCVYKHMSH